MDGLTYRLIDLFIDWSVGWLVGWLVGFYWMAG